MAENFNRGQDAVIKRAETLFCRAAAQLFFAAIKFKIEVDYMQEYDGG